MKVLLTDTTDTFLQRQSNEAHAIPVIQEIVDAYHALRLPVANDGEPVALAQLTGDELLALFEEPKTFIFDKITNGQPVLIADIQLYKPKAIDILERPDGYNNLLQKIEAAKNNQLRDSGNYPILTTASIKTKFELKRNGEVGFKEDYLTQLEESSKSYLHSEIAQNVNAFADDIIEAFNARGLNGKISNSNRLGYFIMQLFGEETNILKKNLSNIRKADNTGFYGHF